MISCVDLFCGLGGLTHGLAKGGVKVVAGVDVDPTCRFPYQANNNSQFLEINVNKVTGDQLRNLWAEERFSLLAGCAPCQPFSTYGRRKGMKSTSKKKWGLLGHFARLIREARPDFVTMENVPQLIHHKVFARFLKSLGEYSVSWDVIECALYGVPQTRRRLVLIASRLGPISLMPPPTNGHDIEGATVRCCHLASKAA